MSYLALNHSLSNLILCVQTPLFSRFYLQRAYKICRHGVHLTCRSPIGGCYFDEAELSPSKYPQDRGCYNSHSIGSESDRWCRSESLSSCGPKEEDCASLCLPDSQLTRCCCCQAAQSKQLNSVEFYSRTRHRCLCSSLEPKEITIVWDPAVTSLF